MLLKLIVEQKSTTLNETLSIPLTTIALDDGKVGCGYCSEGACDDCSSIIEADIALELL